MTPLDRAEDAAPLWLATHEAARAVIPDAMVGYVDPLPPGHPPGRVGGWTSPRASSCAACCTSTDLVAPGIVDCATWRVDPAPAAPADQTSMILGAVARRPAAG